MRPEQQPVPLAPLKPKTSPIVWILAAVGGLFLLGFIALLGAGWFVARNPGLVIGKLITAANPDAEVVSTDMGAQTLRVRNKRTGEEVTLSFDDAKSGRLHFTAVGRNGESADVEIGGGPGKLPAWVPSYPGARAQGNFTAQGSDGSKDGAGGVVAFATSDPPAKVMEFYSDKIAASGLKITDRTADSGGGIIRAQTDDESRKLRVTVGRDSRGTSITLAFGEKNR
jgi:hypothetical protein